MLINHVVIKGSTYMPLKQSNNGTFSSFRMQTRIFVALVLVFCGIQADATDFISRKEFAEFKANVLNYTCIQELTLEKDKQAKQIQYQKKAILVSKRLLAKNDEASTILNHEKSAIISNQSLPQEPTKSSKLISLMSQPQGKTAVTSMYTLSSYTVHIITKERVILQCILQHEAQGTHRSSEQHRP